MNRLVTVQRGEPGRSFGGRGVAPTVEEWEHPTVRAHLTMVDRTTYDLRTVSNAEEAITARVAQLKANHTPYERDGFTLRWAEKDGAQEVELRYENLPGAQP